MPASDQPSRIPPADQHLPDALPADPLPLLASWLDDARSHRILPNPNAMTLATVGTDGRPSARIVLCKGIDPKAGSLTFYTNYESRKGQDLRANPFAAAVFFWDPLDRQARVEGRIVQSTPDESDAYFASRPLESRVGAWASEQSRPVASREAMAERVAGAMRRLGLDPRATSAGAGVSVPRPPHWGGYRLHAERVELWVSGPGRIHDRAAWTRTLAPAGGGFSAGSWTSTRLQP